MRDYHLAQILRGAMVKYAACKEIKMHLANARADLHNYYKSEHMKPVWDSDIKSDVVVRWDNINYLVKLDLVNHHMTSIRSIEML